MTSRDDTYAAGGTTWHRSWTVPDGQAVSAGRYEWTSACGRCVAYADGYHRPRADQPLSRLYRTRVDGRVGGRTYPTLPQAMVAAVLAIRRAA